MNLHNKLKDKYINMFKKNILIINFIFIQKENMLNALMQMLDGWQLLFMYINGIKFNQLVGLRKKLRY